MKKILVVMCFVLYSFAQHSITLHFQAEDSSGTIIPYYTQTFNEGSFGTFKSYTLPSKISAWQKFYDGIAQSNLYFPLGSVSSNIDVYITQKSFDFSNPGKLLDPSGKNIDLFMFLEVDIKENGQSISYVAPVGHEPYLVINNLNLISLLSTYGVTSVNGVSFGYYANKQYTMEGISAEVGFISTTVKFSHFSTICAWNKSASSIEKINNLPGEFKLKQNYPNPFNPNTTINFSVKKESNVEINVYNSLGKLIKTIANKRFDVGEYKITFDGSNLSSGVYYYSFSIDGKKIDVKKMILLK